MLQLPGLVDVHVHLREPGAIHKEDFASGTAAALAGGVTAVLAMPNTDPPLVDQNSLDVALESAGKKAHCDYGVYLGAAVNNAREAGRIAPQAAGLKMYLDATYGPLLLENTKIWDEHFQNWPAGKAIAVHAERTTLAAVLFFSQLYQRPIHVCHVSRREEIQLIKKAKQKGCPVTCEVAPHHLFLTEKDAPDIGPGRSEVRPVLNSNRDQQALWDNLDYIDCIATDHAPHLLEEKDSSQPPPGFPGLETMLPLLMTAVKEGRITIEDVIQKTHTNPRKIFSIPEQQETWVELDPDHEFTLQGSRMHTRCSWTPFEGRRVFGKVRRVVLRGKTVFEDGQVVGQPGYGNKII